MDKQEEYDNKMKASATRREFIVREINRLVDEYKTLEKQEQTWEDEEFVRTGSFTTSFTLNISITEEDMIRDLINKTEGKNIKIKKPNNN